MFASKDIFLKSSGGGVAYQISRSVRLRSSASAYLNRTPSSTTNRNTFTWSGWVKRGSLVFQMLFEAHFDNTNRSGFAFENDTLTLFHVQAGSVTVRLYTTPLYRDPSAWYHIVLQYDDTQATASNRAKIYVNGAQVTSLSTATYPSQNYGALIYNTNNSHNIGRQQAGGGGNFDGYMTEVNFIDGQALTPSSFGETDAITGVWKPKKYAGTYGTNGFYLNFSDNSNNTAATIGKDNSGNGNNWTPNNISVTAGATYDSMLDVPTFYDDTGNGRGNYAVLNAVNKGSGITISNGNLNAVFTSGWQNVISTIGMPSGKWYWEVTITSLSSIMMIGICKSTFSLSTALGTDAAGASWSYFSSNGNKYFQNTDAAYGASYGAGNVIGVAFDATNGTLTFYKDNTSQGTAFTGIASDIYFPVSGVNNSGEHNVNFGQRPFAYTPPTGFVALNTQNLPTPTISNGATVMAATLYTGNATARTISNSVNGISFQPDLVWLKMRSAGSYLNHHLVDSVRGDGKVLYSNLTNAEDNLGSTTIYTTSTGFGLSAGVGVNENAQTFVGWQWNAGGSTVTNTSGSISAQVRANPTAGFSVVTYTGTGSAATIGHGLGVAPQMIIIFERSPGGDDHIVYHASLTSNQYSIRLNTAAAQAGPSGAYWNSTSPTSTVFSVGTSGESNQSTATYVAYCFAPVAGYSAFGKYTGNGSADGTFVYLGFRPRFIIVKDTSAANTWQMWDTSRTPYNLVNGVLYPSFSNAETSSGTSDIDILSNGFKVRTSNSNLGTNGNVYIYMAFAENPFKLSLAR